MKGDLHLSEGVLFREGVRVPAILPGYPYMRAGEIWWGSSVVTYHAVEVFRVLSIRDDDVLWVWSEDRAAWVSYLTDFSIPKVVQTMQGHSHKKHWRLQPHKPESLGATSSEEDAPSWVSDVDPCVCGAHPKLVKGSAPGWRFRLICGSYEAFSNIPAGVIDEWNEMMQEAREEGITGHLDTPDPVNHPSHYTQGGIECLDAIRAMLGTGYIDFLRGMVERYLWRMPHKGAMLQDAEKALFYARELVLELGGNPDVAEGRKEIDRG